MSSDDIPREPRAFFGRRKGHHAARRSRRRCSTRCCRGSRSILNDPRRPTLRTLFPHPVDDVRLEIGFGGGEHLIAQAEQHPRTGFIGIEPFVNGMAKALAAIDAHRLTNIRLHFGDATDLLAWLPDACVGARRSALSRSVAEAPALEAALRAGRDASRRSRGCCGRAANSASPPTLPITPPGRCSAACARSDFVWTAERADDWRQPWPGFTGDALRGQGQARRPHAVLSDFPAGIG